MICTEFTDKHLESFAVGRTVRFRSGRLSNDRSIFVTGGADMDGKLTCSAHIHPSRRGSCMI